MTEIESNFRIDPNNLNRVIFTRIDGSESALIALTPEQAAELEAYQASRYSAGSPQEEQRRSLVDHIEEVLSHGFYSPTLQ